jgi:hypothetical protein
MPTILLVDDDRMILELCDRVLAGLSGLCVLQADSGAEALDTAARHPGTIELLIADILMPGGIDGVELAAPRGGEPAVHPRIINVRLPARGLRLERFVAVPLETISRVRSGVKGGGNTGNALFCSWMNYVVRQRLWRAAAGDLAVCVTGGVGTCRNFYIPCR